MRLCVSSCVLETLKSRARALKNEVLAVYLAAKDPRTPWYVKALVFFVVAHTFSPIDLIPDFIPVLGYLDDLIVTPLGLALAIRLIPPEVLAEARSRVAGSDVGRGVGALGAVLVVLAWIATAAFLVYLVLFLRS
jgi:uncharacterized membrane protein YkvA (DUF1232 family)